MSIRRVGRLWKDDKDKDKDKDKEKDKVPLNYVNKERFILWIDDKPNGEAHHLAALWGRTDPAIEFKIFQVYDDFRNYCMTHERHLKALKKIRVITSRVHEDGGPAEKLLMWLRAESPIAEVKVLVLLSDEKQAKGMEHFANSKTFLNADITFCQDFALFKSTSKKKDRKSMMSRASGGGAATLLRNSSAGIVGPILNAPANAVALLRENTPNRTASPSTPVKPTEATMSISMPYAVSRASDVKTPVPVDAPVLARPTAPLNISMPYAVSRATDAGTTKPRPPTASAATAAPKLNLSAVGAGDSATAGSMRRSPRHGAVLPLTVLFIDDLGGPLSSTMQQFSRSEEGSYFWFANAAEVEQWIKERKADFKALREVRVMCNRDSSLGHAGVESFVTWVRKGSPFPRAKALVFCKSTAGVSFPSLHLLGFGLTFVSADINYLHTFASFDGRVTYATPALQTPDSTRSRATVTIGTTDEASLPPAIQAQHSARDAGQLSPATLAVGTTAPKIHVSAQELEVLKQKAIRDYEMSLAATGMSKKSVKQRLSMGLGLSSKEGKKEKKLSKHATGDITPTKEVSISGPITSASAAAAALRMSPRPGWAPVSVSTPSSVPALKLPSPRGTPTPLSRSQRNIVEVHMIPLNELEAMLGDLPATSSAATTPTSTPPQTPSTSKVVDPRSSVVVPPRPSRRPPDSPKQSSAPKSPAIPAQTGYMIPQEELDALLGSTLIEESPIAKARIMQPHTLSFDFEDGKDRSTSVWARETLDELASELRNPASSEVSPAKPQPVATNAIPPPLPADFEGRKQSATRAPAVNFSLPSMTPLPPSAPQAPPNPPGQPRVWRSKQAAGDITRGEKVQVLPNLGLDTVFGVSQPVLRGAPIGSAYRWRIEAMLPTLRNAPIPNPVALEPLNVFCSRDCYLVAAAPSPPRETVWNVYYWIGKQASPDKVGSVAIRATQLNQLLGGGGKHRREEEGEESEDFVKLFADGIEIDPEGGTDSAFRSAVLLPTAPSLYRLLSSPPTHALHRARLTFVGKALTLRTQVPMMLQCLDMAHMYLLDAGDALFIWSATAPESASRMWLRDLTSLVGVSERSSRAVIHLLEGLHLPISESSQMFLSMLNVPLEIDNDGCYVIPDLAPNIPAALSRRMYRVAIADTLICSEIWAAEIDNPEQQGGLLPSLAPQSLLVDDECRILDCGSELFLWLGRRSTAPLRKVAEGLLSQLHQSGGRDNWVPLPNSVLQGRETVFLRTQFNGWVDPRRDVSSRLRPAAVANKKQQDKNALNREKERKPFTDRNYARLQVAQDGTEDTSGNTQPLMEDETERGWVSAYLLTKSGSKAEPMAKSESGQFYSGECYVVIDPRRPRPAMYFWQGAEARTSLLKYLHLAETLAAPRTWPTFCLSLAPSLELEVTQRGLPQPSRVPILQGREPPVFWSLLGESIVIHQGKRPPSGTPDPRVALYQLRNIAAPPRLVATETVPVGSSLQSRFSYLLRTFARIIRWNGVLSPPLSSGALDPILTTLSQDGLVPLANTKEGNEAIEFWDYLGGKRPYTNEQFWRSHTSTARLFCLSRLIEDAQVDEVKPFTQADLSETENAAFLLDQCTSTTLYLWLPRILSEAQHASAVFLSLCFCRSQERAQSLATGVLQLKVALEGSEPPEFCAYFPYWYQREGAVITTDDAVKFAAQRHERLMGVEASKVAELQARPEPEPIIVEVTKVPLSKPVLAARSTPLPKSAAILAAAAALQPQLLSRASSSGSNPPVASIVTGEPAAVFGLESSASSHDTSSIPLQESSEDRPTLFRRVGSSPLARLPRPSRPHFDQQIQRVAGPVGRRPRTRKSKATPLSSARSSIDPEMQSTIEAAAPASELDPKLLDAVRKLDELPAGEAEAQGTAWAGPESEVSSDQAESSDTSIAVLGSTTDVCSDGGLVGPVESLRLAHRRQPHSPVEIPPLAAPLTDSTSSTSPAPSLPMRSADPTPPSSPVSQAIPAAIASSPMPLVPLSLPPIANLPPCFANTAATLPPPPAMSMLSRSSQAHRVLPSFPPPPLPLASPLSVPTVLPSPIPPPALPAATLPAPVDPLRAEQDAHLISSETSTSLPLSPSVPHEVPAPTSPAQPIPTFSPLAIRWRDLLRDTLKLTFETADRMAIILAQEDVDLAQLDDLTTETLLALNFSEKEADVLMRNLAAHKGAPG